MNSKKDDDNSASRNRRRDGIHKAFKPLQVNVPYHGRVEQSRSCLSVPVNSRAKRIAAKKPELETIFENEADKPGSETREIETVDKQLEELSDCASASRDISHRARNTVKSDFLADIASKVGSATARKGFKPLKTNVPYYGKVEQSKSCLAVPYNSRAKRIFAQKPGLETIVENEVDESSEETREIENVDKQLKKSSDCASSAPRKISDRARNIVKSDFLADIASKVSSKSGRKGFKQHETTVPYYGKVEQSKSCLAVPYNSRATRIVAKEPDAETIFGSEVNDPSDETREIEYVDDEPLKNPSDCENSAEREITDPPRNTLESDFSADIVSKVCSTSARKGFKPYKSNIHYYGKVEQSRSRLSVTHNWRLHRTENEKPVSETIVASETGIPTDEPPAFEYNDIDTSSVDRDIVRHEISDNPDIDLDLSNPHDVEQSRSRRDESEDSVELEIAKLGIHLETTSALDGESNVENERWQPIDFSPQELLIQVETIKNCEIRDWEPIQLSLNEPSILREQTSEPEPDEEPKRSHSNVQESEPLESVVYGPSSSKQPHLELNAKRKRDICGNVNPPSVPAPAPTCNLESTSASAEDQQNSGKRVIKVGFRKFCKDDDIFETVDNQVKVISKLSIEVTYFAEFCFRHATNSWLRDNWTEKGPNHLQLALLFKEKQFAQAEIPPELRLLFQEYLKLRNSKLRGDDAKLYDCEGMASMIQEMARNLDKNFKTNIVTHAKSRISKLLMGPGRENTVVRREATPDEIVKEIERREKRRLRNLRKRQRRRESRRIRNCEENIAHKDEMLQLRKDRINQEREKVYMKRKTWIRKKKTDKPPTMTKEEKEKREAKRKERERTYKERRRKVVEKVKHLFDKNECDDPAFQRLLVPDEKLDFSKFEKNYHKFLPFFQRLQRHFSQNNIHNFKVIPVMSCGRKHLLYTNTGLADLESNVKGRLRKASGAKKIKGPNRPREVIQKEKEEKALAAAIRKEYLRIKKEKKEKLKELIEERNEHYQLLKDWKQPLTNLAIEDICAIETQHQFLSVEADQLDKEIKAGSKEKADERKVKNAEKYEANEDRWIRLFNFDLLNTGKDDKFSGTITTDGVSVSVIYDTKKEVEEVDDESAEKTSKKRKTNSASSEESIFKRFVGLDPGKKAAMAGVIREGSPEPSQSDKTKDKHVYIRGASFRWQSGHQRRREKLNKLTNYEEYYQELSQKPEYENISLMNPDDYVRVTLYRLEGFGAMQKLFEKRSVARLKWDKYMCVNREVDMLVNFIIGNVKEKPCFVSMGSTKISKTMKGYLSSPLKLMEQRLRQRAKKLGPDKLKIVTVDEHCTTQMCSNCVQQMNVVSHHRHRYAVCSNCRVTWERDINAGRNMLNIGLIKEGIISKSLIPNPDNFRALRAEIAS